MLYRPGQAVPRAGNYIVYHRDHRLDHPASIDLGNFPSCESCGEDVRFEQINGSTVFPVLAIAADEDFLSAAIDVAIGL